MPCGFKSSPFLLSTITWVKSPSWVSCCICFTLSLWIINQEGLGVRWMDKCLEQCLRLASRLYGPHGSGTRQGNNLKLPWVEPDAQTCFIRSQYLSSPTHSRCTLLGWQLQNVQRACGAPAFTFPLGLEFGSPMGMVFTYYIRYSWISSMGISCSRHGFFKRDILSCYLLGRPVENYK